MTAALTHIVDVKIPCNCDLHFWLHWTFGGPATQLCIIFNQDDAATRNINWEPFLADSRMVNIITARAFYPLFYSIALANFSASFSRVCLVHVNQCLDMLLM